ASLAAGNKSLEALRAAIGEAAVEALDQLPFKSQNRYSAVRLRSGGQEMTLALGAPEALRPFASSGWEGAWQTLLSTGLRLLLFAEGRRTGGDSGFAGTLEGYHLTPLALLGLSDELRPEAAAVLADLAGQGIRFKIISGDNPETVRATVRPLGEGSDQ